MRIQLWDIKMAQQGIDIGAQGNDGTGDSIREAFRKANDNFTELYAVFGQGGQIRSTNLSDFPTSYTGNQIFVTEGAQGQVSHAVLAKDLVAGTGIHINQTDTTLTIVNAGSSFSADTSPNLGGPLNAAGAAIANVASPSELALTQFITAHPNVLINGKTPTQDAFVITQGYADQRYIQQTGGGSTAGQIRVRYEPNSRSAYTKTIVGFANGGVTVTAHGFNSGSNGIAFTYNSTGISATNLTKGTTYYLRYIDADHLGLYPTALDAKNGTNSISASGGSGTQTLTDAAEDPTLSGNWLANEALPRTSVVRREGDTMTGLLQLSDHPGSLAGAGSPNGPDDLQAATKYYVDNSSFASNVNLFVTTTGDDTQKNTPHGKEGRAFAYAYSTIGAACLKAQQLMDLASLEPGPYRQKITYTVAAVTSPSVLQSINIVSGPGYQTVQDNLQANKEWIKAEVIGYLNTTYPTLTYNRDTCARDIGYIIDAVCNDVIVNGTYQSITAGKNYFKNISALTASGVQNSQTVAGIQYANSLCDYVLNNNNPPTAYQTVYSRTARITTNGAVSSPMIAAVDSKFSIIVGYIQNGLSWQSAPVFSYGSATYNLTITNGGQGFVDQGNPSNDDIVPGKIIRGLSSGAEAKIVSYTAGSSTDVISTYLLTTQGFLPSEQMEFAESNKTLQITIRVESGVYYEELPIRIPANVTVKGDEFRRTIIRPRDGASRSAAATTFFYRDNIFDGMTITPGGVQSITIPTTGGTGYFGYHYLKDPSKVLNVGASYTNLGGYTNAAKSLYENRAFIQSEVVAYIVANYPSFSFDSSICQRDTGFIVDAIIADLRAGGNGNAKDMALSFYNADAVTSNAAYIAGLNYINTVAQRIIAQTLLTGSTTPHKLSTATQIIDSSLTAESGSATAITNLVGTVTFAFNTNYNPPKNNKEMDMFFMNDAVKIHNVSGQGQGGFMCVLDPAGVIGSKSPYVQSCSSFSGSINAQRFAGGMFIDGFAGRLKASIANSGAVTNSGLTITVTGLTYRQPIGPTAFYQSGYRYQVDNVASWDPNTGVAVLNLNPTTPWPGLYSTTYPYAMVLETPGNRSMLANDFTQVNDLGYGIVAHNTGLTEQVSTFTYYCYSAYMASNGGQIRSVAGSNAHGVYGLRAAGSDPTEAPDSINLSSDMVQSIKVFKSGAQSTTGYLSDVQFYMQRYQSIPTNTSELEIYHAVGPTRYEVKNVQRTGVSFNNKTHRVTAITRVSTGAVVSTLADATITGITLANPCQVTATSHGFETGDIVRLYGIVGTTQLNNGSYYINRVDANNFTLYKDSALATAINSSGYTAYISSGTASSRHTFHSGDAVVFSNTTMSEINGNVYYVNPVSTTSFVLYTDKALTTPVNSSSFANPFTAGSTSAGSFTSGRYYTIETVGTTVWTSIGATATTSFSGYISNGTSGVAGTVLTVTSTPTSAVTIGQQLSGVGVTAGTVVTGYGSGTGFAGTYTVSASQAAGTSGSPITISGIAPGTSFTASGVGAGTGTAYYGGSVTNKVNWNISGATLANPCVVTTSLANNFKTGDLITISGVSGVALGSSSINSSFYISVLTSQTFALYSDADLVTSFSSTGFSSYSTGGTASGGQEVLQINLSTSANDNRTSTGLSEPIYDDQNMSIRVLQNFKFYNVDNVKPTRPSTALQFTDTQNFTANNLYRVIAYNLTESTGALVSNDQHTAILSADQSFAYITPLVLVTAIGVTDPNNSLKTMGATIGDTNIAVDPTSVSADGIAACNSGKWQFSWDGKTHTVLGYTAASNSVPIAASSFTNGTTYTIAILGNTPWLSIGATPTITVTATISGTVMNVTNVSAGYSSALAVGMQLTGGTIPLGTTITSFGSGQGFTGTYNISSSFNPAVGPITVQAIKIGSVFVATSVSSADGSTGTATVSVPAYITINDAYDNNTVANQVTAGNFIVGQTYTITFTGTTSFTGIGASSNAVGTVFTATGTAGTRVGSGTGRATPIGINSPFPTTQAETLRMGLPRSSAGFVTIKISTCRANSHDFLDIGTGGYNTTNYPYAIYGNPAIPHDQAREVKEENKGRVFYVSTDQDGIFRVGPFFKVDQGTGAVTFSASIALSNLDGLGFKRGVVVAEFSTDSALTNNATDTVATQSAIRGFVDKRLGLDYSGIPVIPTNLIGPGYMALNGALSMKGNMNLAGFNILNVGAPSNASDAANKSYVDTSVATTNQLNKLQDVLEMTPIAGDLLAFSGANNASVTVNIAGDLVPTYSSANTTTLLGGITNSPTVDSGIVGTGQTSVSGGIAVLSTTGFPASGYIQIDNEIFSYSSIASNKFMGIARALNTSTAATHAASVAVLGLNNAQLQLVVGAGAIVDSKVSASAAIAQSKLALSNATAASSAGAAVKGIAKFNSANFSDDGGGYISIKTNGVTLNNIATISNGSVLANFSGSAAAPAETTAGTVVGKGFDSLFNTSGVVSFTTGSPNSYGTIATTTTGGGSSLVRTDSSGNITAAGVKIVSGGNTPTILSIASNSLSIATPGGLAFIVTSGSGGGTTAQNTSINLYGQFALIGQSSLSGNITATFATSATNADKLNLGGSYVSADTANTVSTIVARDGSGNFSAGTITASGFSGPLSGNASTANKLSSAVNINGVSFDGSASITIPLSGAVTTSSISANGTPQVGGQYVGTISGAWSLASGASLTATYADLAEYYSSDQEYEPGTVLVFGGDAEVTTTSIFGDARLAGVVSTNAAYAMNSELAGTRSLVALQGRVPVKVLGMIKKGDMLTTAGIPGYAVKATDPKIGTIIGKALADKTTSEAGIIEVAVGRV
jgi:hypothetical protein